MAAIDWIIGLGVLAVIGGGFFLYARSQDEKDPFGYLSDLFQQGIDPKGFMKKTVTDRTDFYKETGFRGRSLD